MIKVFRYWNFGLNNFYRLHFKQEMNDPDQVTNQTVTVSQMTSLTFNQGSEITRFSFIRTEIENEQKTKF